jgi:tetrahydromethanopterin S-methyltransferase subunit G
MRMEITRQIQVSAEPEKKHSAWYLLTGLIIGLILGLVYAWLINPVVYENTEPASLKMEYKDVYRSMIAQVFAATGNFERASRRLDLLDDQDPFFTLGQQAQRALANGSTAEAQALALLASVIQTGAALPATPGSTQATPPIATENTIPTQTLPALTPIP